LQNCEKATIGFVMPARQSACAYPHGTTRFPTGRIFMKFDIFRVFRKSVAKTSRSIII
jgi:hypothetical protein